MSDHLLPVKKRVMIVPEQMVFVGVVQFKGIPHITPQHSNAKTKILFNAPPPSLGLSRNKKNLFIKLYLNARTFILKLNAVVRRYFIF